MVLVQVFLQKGLPQAVSKFLAQYPDRQKVIFQKSFKIQFYVALIFTLIYFLGADIIASFFLKDPSLTSYIRLSSLLILPSAFWALYSSGFLNGKMLFKHQAFTRIVHSLSKLLLVFLAILAGFKINGLIGAHILAALIALLIAKSFSKIKTDHPSFPTQKIISFAFPIIVFAASYRLLRYLDLLLIKKILADNTLAGFYTSAMTLSEISLFLFVALPFTLLPSLSKSIATKDTLTTKSYINKSLRYALLLMVPLAFIISATSKNLISLFYSTEFAPAASALSILVFGTTFLSLFSINCTIITSSGRPKITMFFGLLLIPLTIILNYFFIPLYSITGAALATTLTVLFGTIITSIYIYHKFKTLTSYKSTIKISLASLIIYYLALTYQFSSLWLLLTYLILIIIYFLILFAFNEIKQTDIKLIRKLILK